MYKSRSKLVDIYTSDELFTFLLDAATQSNFRRFQTAQLKENFFKKINSWKEVRRKKDGEKDRLTYSYNDVRWSFNA